MKSFIYYNQSTNSHLISPITQPNPNYILLFRCNNLHELTDLNELTIVLDYLRQRYLTPEQPSNETINKLSQQFPTLFSLAFRENSNQEQSYGTFFPYWNKYTVYFNTISNTFNISCSPQFGSRKTHQVLAVIDGLEQITRPQDLIASLNLIKLGKTPIFDLSKEVISNQVSLFPELFVI